MKAKKRQENDELEIIYLFILIIQRSYVFKELNLVILCHTQIRNILLKYGRRYRQSKITL
jgi:hypothetical protein